MLSTKCVCLNVSTWLLTSSQSCWPIICCHGTCQTSLPAFRKNQSNQWDKLVFCFVFFQRTSHFGNRCKEGSCQKNKNEYHWANPLFTTSIKPFNCVSTDHEITSGLDWTLVHRVKLQKSDGSFQSVIVTDETETSVSIVLYTNTYYKSHWLLSCVLLWHYFTTRARHQANTVQFLYAVYVSFVSSRS